MAKSEINGLLKALESAEAADGFQPILVGLREIFYRYGINADRLQVPMTQPLGFRDPRYWGVILTWRRQNDVVTSQWVDHERARRLGLPKVVGGKPDPGCPAQGSESPYWRVSESEARYFRTNLAEETHGYEVLEGLQKEGLRDYCCFGLSIPGSELPALISLASQKAFPDDLFERLSGLREVLSLCLYGAYRGSQARRIAQTYIGHETGRRVLNGAISRGCEETLEAGIMFCDIRGYTALSERLGDGILPIMNTVFQALGEEVEKEGGEILKFIGDAMLVAYGLEGRSREAVSQSMVATVQASFPRIRAIATALDEPVRVGFGCHLGPVVYGNVGTSERLDYTVVGPAVNLASRLERLAKKLGVGAVFSQPIQSGCSQLRFGGVHQLKDIAQPTPIWLLSQPMQIGAIP